MAAIEYRLLDGTVLVDKREETHLADEVAWERQFKLPSAILSVQERKRAAYELACAEAEEAGGPAPEPTAEVFAPSEWIVFFSWCRLAREHPDKVPATFQAFLAAVQSWETLPDPEDEAQGEGSDADAEGGDTVDPFEAALIDAGGGLDPTAPARRPTRQPTSSSLDSTGAR